MQLLQKGGDLRSLVPVDIVEMHGSDQLWMNSAADWGVCDPLATLKAAEEMRLRGHTEQLIEKIFYENPASFLGQCRKFKI